MSRFVDFFHRVDRWFVDLPVSLTLLSAFLTGMLMVIIVAGVVILISSVSR